MTDIYKNRFLKTPPPPPQSQSELPPEEEFPLPETGLDPETDPGEAPPLPDFDEGLESDGVSGWGEEVPQSKPADKLSADERRTLEKHQKIAHEVEVKLKSLESKNNLKPREVQSILSEIEDDLKFLEAQEKTLDRKGVDVDQVIDQDAGDLEKKFSQFEKKTEDKKKADMKTEEAKIEKEAKAMADKREKKKKGDKEVDDVFKKLKDTQASGAYKVKINANHGYVDFDEVFATAAKCLKSGDWAPFSAQLKAIKGDVKWKSLDSVVGYIGMVLMEAVPDKMFDKIPNSILVEMTQLINSGQYIGINKLRLNGKKYSGEDVAQHLSGIIQDRKAGHI